MAAPQLAGNLQAYKISPCLILSFTKDTSADTSAENEPTLISFGCFSLLLWNAFKTRKAKLPVSANQIYVFIHSNNFEQNQ